MLKIQICTVCLNVVYVVCLFVLQSCLEFSLRIQEFIELIRQNKRMDAVRYSTLTHTPILIWTIENRSYACLIPSRHLHMMQYASSQPFNLTMFLCLFMLPICEPDMQGSTSARQKVDSWMRSGRWWACSPSHQIHIFPHTRYGSFLNWILLVSKMCTACLWPIHFWQHNNIFTGHPNNTQVQSPFLSVDCNVSAFGHKVAPVVSDFQITVNCWQAIWIHSSI